MAQTLIIQIFLKIFGFSRRLQVEQLKSLSFFYFLFISAGNQLSFSSVCESAALHRSITVNRNIRSRFTVWQTSCSTMAMRQLLPLNIFLLLLLLHPHLTWSVYCTVDVMRKHRKAWKRHQRFNLRLKWSGRCMKQKLIFIPELLSLPSQLQLPPVGAIISSSPAISLSQDWKKRKKREAGEEEAQWGGGGGWMGAGQLSSHMEEKTAAAAKKPEERFTRKLNELKLWRKRRWMGRSASHLPPHLSSSSSILHPPPSLHPSPESLMRVCVAQNARVWRRQAEISQRLQFHSRLLVQNSRRSWTIRRMKDDFTTWYQLDSESFTGTDQNVTVHRRKAGIQLAGSIMWQQLVQNSDLLYNNNHLPVLCYICKNIHLHPHYWYWNVDTVQEES